MSDANFWIVAAFAIGILCGLVLAKGIQIRQAGRALTDIYWWTRPAAELWAFEGEQP